jgi:hypothetical protein
MCLKVCLVCLAGVPGVPGVPRAPRVSGVLGVPGLRDALCALLFVFRRKTNACHAKSVTN